VRSEVLEPTEEDWRLWGVDPARRPKQGPEQKGGRNMNLYFLCVGPEQGNANVFGYRLLKGLVHNKNHPDDGQYQGYFFTFTSTHNRMRYLPGYKLVSDAQGVAPEIGRQHHIVALRLGKLIRYFVDGKLVHERLDERKLSPCRMGFCIWRSHVKVHEFNVYRIAGNSD